MSVLYTCRSFLSKIAKPNRQSLQPSRKFTHSSILEASNGLTRPQIAADSPVKLWKYARRTGYFLGALGATYVIDKNYNASSIQRNLRTFWTCALITVDYKLNFTPEKSSSIPELHERVGQRVYDLLSSNGGLYIKIGQAIAANAATLPPAIQAKFTSLFDDAPQIPYSVVEAVFLKELGRLPSGPDGVFEIFEEQAVASASIAQVHKAKLWPRIGEDGKPETEERWVAVKVQKPDVSKQMKWDLGAFRMVMWMFEHWAFELPVYFMVDFISDHLRRELDFVQEAENSRQTTDFIANEPRLRDKVYIPKTYPEFSTKRVMVAEWIDGVRLSDKPGIFRLMGQPLPAKMSSDIQPIASGSSFLGTTSQSTVQPISSFQLPSQPLKGGVKSIMQTMVELFSAQMFEWGQVHCDPHPGNVLVRPSPSNPRHPQIVLLDHGLYVRLPEEFKRDWARLWRAMLVGDYKGVENVTKGWGFGLPDLVASFTLMRPTILKMGRKQKEERKQGKDNLPLTEYELSVMMKARLQEFLADTDRMPKALIFLNRNMQIMQANNQSFGTPVNRTKITGYWASRSQARNINLSLSERLNEWWRHIVFRSRMLRLAFWKTFILITYRTGTAATEEQRIQAIRNFLSDSMDIEIPEDVFVKMSKESPT